jgi:hypothetical protein
MRKEKEEGGARGFGRGCRPAPLVLGGTRFGRAGTSRSRSRPAARPVVRRSESRNRNKMSDCIIGFRG